MKKIAALIIPLILVFSNAYADGTQDKSYGSETGISTDNNKTYIKEGEIYPYIVIEQNPLIAAVRGNIYGQINEGSLINSMSALSNEYKLSGWIKKTPDGSYQFHLEGDPSKVRDAVGKIQSCDKASKIESVTSKTAVPTKYIKGFKLINDDDKKENE